jgi:hypothetical protein
MNKNESKYYNTALIMDEALLLILEKKDFEFITVKELCKKAGVSRSTFYLHYETMDDLLNEVIKNTNKEFMNYFNNSSTDINEFINNKDLNQLMFLAPQYLKPFVSYVYENRKLYKLILDRPVLFKSEQSFKNLYKGIFKPIMTCFNIDENLQKYVVNYYCSGINAIINEWLKGNCKENVDEIINIITWCLGKNIEKYNEYNK